MEPVLIKKKILEAMIHHAREEAPLECCGLLTGTGKTITHLTRMTNVLSSEQRYSMDPQSLFSFFKHLRSLKLRHLGIYHSHPASEAYPSRIDVDESYYPECAYLIVSLKDTQSPSVRAFSIADRSVVERELHILD
jgi:[CysO sulfur-carrier protein]-S-L-cysteine hydrolase